MLIINSQHHKTQLYKITLDAGMMYPMSYYAYARNKQEAIDIVADYIEEQELRGLYCDWYEIADICGMGETPDDVINKHQLTVAGTHGIYIKLRS